VQFHAACRTLRAALALPQQRAQRTAGRQRETVHVVRTTATRSQNQQNAIIVMQPVVLPGYST
jgi:hypothetical protein